MSDVGSVVGGAVAGGVVDAVVLDTHALVWLMQGSERVGSVAEEAFKLFVALSSRGSGSQKSGTQGSAGRHSSAAPSASADGDATPHVCSASWCPVCQVVGFVKDNPEALAQVSRSAAQLTTSLRDLLQGAMTPQEKP